MTYYYQDVIYDVTYRFYVNASVLQLHNPCNSFWRELEWI